MKKTFSFLNRNYKENNNQYNKILINRNQHKQELKKQELVQLNFKVKQMKDQSKQMMKIKKQYWIQFLQNQIQNQNQNSNYKKWKQIKLQVEYQKIHQEILKNQMNNIQIK
ncbi:hypothetical protein IMG5_124530 [Ichthyophthirius multifiliis]|uniref:Uncharacterized protein n=1 Tax=Ichthyophthirius multifiliis TaxID=5932 RepID=G0QVL8_ICHMU|nr:hypothetical protein IMG5_124530 [Ichthyophthirius multifiliis]EGR30741.1 hypothetical protein IMG5_124530 [Ichthyophthirius multifiliis]|eukprot:XP_004032328.1 hypothetical protein IMG5_124530 [Ichthyophthirius multifiliis]